MDLSKKVRFYWQDKHEGSRGFLVRQLIKEVTIRSFDELRDWSMKLQSRFPVPEKMQWLFVIDS